jgi:chromosome segregation ATPase
VDAAAAHVRMVETALNTLRASELSVRTELHQISVIAAERKAAIDSHDAVAEALHEKLQESEQALVACKKKVGDLKSKCGSLTQQYEAERRKR